MATPVLVDIVGGVLGLWAVAELLGARSSARDALASSHVFLRVARPGAGGAPDAERGAHHVVDAAGVVLLFAVYAEAIGPLGAHVFGDVLHGLLAAVSLVAIAVLVIRAHRAVRSARRASPGSGAGDSNADLSA